MWARLSRALDNRQKKPTRRRSSSTIASSSAPKEHEASTADASSSKSNNNIITSPSPLKSRPMKADTVRDRQEHGHRRRRSRSLDGRMEGRRDRSRSRSLDGKSEGRRRRNGSRERRSTKDDAEERRERRERKHRGLTRSETEPIQQGGGMGQPNLTRSDTYGPSSFPIPQAGVAPVNTQYHGPFHGSSIVTDQFPGQVPSQTSAPYRPPLSVNEGGPGLATDYYGDHGESVADQPGVRPPRPNLIVGAEPHLLPASPVAAPPPEPSSLGQTGAAADFYGGSSMPDSQPAIPLSKPGPSSGKPGKTSGEASIVGSVTVGASATYGGTNVPNPQPTMAPSKPGPLSDKLGNTSSGTLIAGVATTGASAPASSFATVRPHGQQGYDGSAPARPSHSTSPPVIPTIGAVAAGAAVGYIAGQQAHHEHQHQYPPPGASDGGVAINLAAASQNRPTKPKKQSAPHGSGPSTSATATAMIAPTVGAHYSTQQAIGSSRMSTGSIYPSAALAYKQRRTGPLRKFIDFWKDPEGVGQFEEYSEYIGVCQGCFEPGSSPRDAPRKHHYRRRRQSDRYGSSSTRIDKEARYYSDGSSGRGKKSGSWITAGLTGYGLGKIGESLLRRRSGSGDFRKKGQRHTRKSSSSSLGQSGSHSSGSRRYSSPSGGSEIIVAQTRHRSRSSSRSRRHTPKQTGGSDRSSLHKTESRHTSSGDRHHEGRHNYTSASHSVHSQRLFDQNSIGGTSENGEQRKRTKKPSRKGFFSFNNSSTSSSSSDAEPVIRHKSGTAKPSKNKRKPRQGDDAVILGLGSAAALYAASQLAKADRGKEHKGRGQTSVRFSSPSRKKHKSSSSSRSDDDGWESASGTGTSSTGQSALAFGDFYGRKPSKPRRSRESLLSDGSSGTDKWGWRWGEGRGKQRKKPGHSSKTTSQHQIPVTGIVTTGVTGSAVASERPTRQSDSSNKADQNRFYAEAPLQHVYPVPTSDPRQFDVKLKESVPTYMQPVVDPPPSSVPLQQPQPVIPVSAAVYSGQGPTQPSYTAPSGPPVFSQVPSNPIVYQVAPAAAFPWDDTSSLVAADTVISGPSSLRDTTMPHRRYTDPTASTRISDQGSTSRPRATTRDQASAPVLNMIGEELPVHNHAEAERDGVRLRRREEARKERARVVEAEERAALDRMQRKARKQSEMSRDHKSADPGPPVEASLPKAGKDAWTRIVAAATTAVLAGASATDSNRTEPASNGSVQITQPESGLPSDKGWAKQTRHAIETRDHENRPQGFGYDASRATGDEYSDVPSVLDKYKEPDLPISSYVTPPELLHSDERSEDRKPVSNETLDSFEVPEIITIAPPDVDDNSPISPSLPSSTTREESGYGLMLFPWIIPRINLIKPTPPGSVVSSVSEARSAPPSPVSVKGGRGDEPANLEDTSRPGGQASPETSRGKELPAESLFRSDGGDLKGVDVQWNEQQEVRESTRDFDRPTAFPGTGAHYGIRHIPGEFTDDIEFAATLAAGLEDTGFDPSIVIENDTFRRRDSPPGSEEPGTYRAFPVPPVVEFVEFDMNLPGGEVTPPQQGFIEGEVTEDFVDAPEGPQETKETTADDRPVSTEQKETQPSPLPTPLDSAFNDHLRDEAAKSYEREQGEGKDKDKQTAVDVDPHGSERRTEDHRVSEGMSSAERSTVADLPREQMAPEKEDSFHSLPGESRPVPFLERFSMDNEKAYQVEDPSKRNKTYRERPAVEDPLDAGPDQISELTSRKSKRRSKKGNKRSESSEQIPLSGAAPEEAENIPKPSGKGKLDKKAVDTESDNFVPGVVVTDAAADELEFITKKSKNKKKAKESRKMELAEEGAAESISPSSRPSEANKLDIKETTLFKDVADDKDRVKDVAKEATMDDFEMPTKKSKKKTKDRRRMEYAEEESADKVVPLVSTPEVTKSDMQDKPISSSDVVDIKPEENRFGDRTQEATVDDFEMSTKRGKKKAKDRQKMGIGEEGLGKSTVPPVSSAEIPSSDVKGEQDDFEDPKSRRKDKKWKSRKSAAEPGRNTHSQASKVESPLRARCRRMVSVLTSVEDSTSKTNRQDPTGPDTRPDVDSTSLSASRSIPLDDSVPDVVPPRPDTAPCSPHMVSPKSKSTDQPYTSLFECTPLDFPPAEEPASDNGLPLPLTGPASPIEIVGSRNLPPLPPSRPTSPIEVGSSKDLPALPTSRPASPIELGIDRNLPPIHPPRPGSCIDVGSSRDLPPLPSSRPTSPIEVGSATDLPALPSSRPSSPTEVGSIRDLPSLSSSRSTSPIEIGSVRDLPTLPSSRPTSPVEVGSVTDLPALPSSRPSSPVEVGSIRDLPSLPSSRPTSPVETGSVRDLSPLPPSRPTSPVEVGSVTDLPALPSSRPSSPIEVGSIRDLPSLPSSRPTSPVETGSVQDLPPLPSSRPTSPVEVGSVTDLPALPSSRPSSPIEVGSIRDLLSLPSSRPTSPVETGSVRDLSPLPSSRPTSPVEVGSVHDLPALSRSPSTLTVEVENMHDMPTKPATQPATPIQVGSVSETSEPRPQPTSAVKVNHVQDLPPLPSTRPTSPIDVGCAGDLPPLPDTRPTSPLNNGNALMPQAASTLPSSHVEEASISELSRAMAGRSASPIEVWEMQDISPLSASQSPVDMSNSGDLPPPPSSGSVSPSGVGSTRDVPTLTSTQPSPPFEVARLQEKPQPEARQSTSPVSTEKLEELRLLTPTGSITPRDLDHARNPPPLPSSRPISPNEVGRVGDLAPLSSTQSTSPIETGNDKAIPRVSSTQPSSQRDLPLPASRSTSPIDVSSLSDPPPLPSTRPTSPIEAGSAQDLPPPPATRSSSPIEDSTAPDLPALPDAQPTSPTKADTVRNPDPLPPSQLHAPSCGNTTLVTSPLLLGSPAESEGRAKSSQFSSPTRTPDSRQISPTHVPSPTAIPIIFRPPFPGSRRPSNDATVGGPSEAYAALTSRSRHSKTGSTEIKPIREVRPLYLVERHSARQSMEVEEVEYPPLPPSRTTTRSPSLHSIESDAARKVSDSEPIPESIPLPGEASDDDLEAPESALPIEADKSNVEVEQEHTRGPTKVGNKVEFTKPHLPPVSHAIAPIGIPGAFPTPSDPDASLRSEPPTPATKDALFQSSSMPGAFPSPSDSGDDTKPSRGALSQGTLAEQLHTPYQLKETIRLLNTASPDPSPEAERPRITSGDNPFESAFAAKAALLNVKDIPLPALHENDLQEPIGSPPGAETSGLASLIGPPENGDAQQVIVPGAEKVSLSTSSGNDLQGRSIDEDERDPEPAPKLFNLVGPFPQIHHDTGHRPTHVLEEGIQHNKKEAEEADAGEEWGAPKGKKGRSKGKKGRLFQQVLTPEAPATGRANDVAEKDVEAWTPGDKKIKGKKKGKKERQALPDILPTPTSMEASNTAAEGLPGSTAPEVEAAALRSGMNDDWTPQSKKGKKGRKGRRERQASIGPVGNQGPEIVSATENIPPEGGKEAMEPSVALPPEAVEVQASLSKEIQPETVTTAPQIQPDLQQEGEDDLWGSVSKKKSKKDKKGKKGQKAAEVPEVSHEEEAIQSISAVEPPIPQDHAVKIPQPQPQNAPASFEHPDMGKEQPSVQVVEQDVLGMKSHATADDYMPSSLTIPNPNQTIQQQQPGELGPADTTQDAQSSGTENKVNLARPETEATAFVETTETLEAAEEGGVKTAQEQIPATTQKGEADVWLGDFISKKEGKKGKKGKKGQANMMNFAEVESTIPPTSAAREVEEGQPSLNPEEGSKIWESPAQLTNTGNESLSPDTRQKFPAETTQEEEHTASLTPEPSWANIIDRRSPSGQSVSSGTKSNLSISRLRTPDRENHRPGSGLSQRLSGTPPPSLRRVDRSLSGDLRAANKREEAKLANNNKINVNAIVNPHLKRELETLPSSSSYDPVKDKGKGRVKDMAAVYEGLGDVHGPPSVRRRQSLQIIDLENKLEQLLSENRQLQASKAKVESSLANALQNQQRDASALSERDVQLRQKDSEIEYLKNSLGWIQGELARLTEINKSLTDSHTELTASHEERYGALQVEYAEEHEKLEQTTRELEELRQQNMAMSSKMESVVREQIDTALEEKDAEIDRLRGELEMAREQIRALQREILESKPQENFLVVRNEDYFEDACQELCRHVQQWVLRFSKSSDMRGCRLVEEVRDDKIIDRLENAILDGTDVDVYLNDRVKRRDVFMSVVMTMVWEFIFTRYLFGMDREQRQKLKTLEKILGEVGPPAAVHLWRATTLTLLSKRPTFEAQRVQDTEAVVQEIYHTLSALLPPPSNLEWQTQESLRKVMRTAVDLSIEMRTQRAEYMMLPPLQPEYDMEGNLARKVYFSASLMNDRSGGGYSNEDLEAQQAVVKMVLFPLVVKRGDDTGTGDEEIVVCPAQVLVSTPPRNVSRSGGNIGKKVVRVISGDGMSIDPRSVSSIGNGNGHPMTETSELDMSNMI